MEELDVNSQLLKEDLFELFKAQLKKDFEGAGLNSSFTEKLPAEFEALKQAVKLQLEVLLKNNTALVSSLLYRIDISEAQLDAYCKKNKVLPFEELLAELIIKRILQKVILKKRFSEK